MLLIIDLIIPAVFILLGVLFQKGKGTFLIAGYNTASKKEREKIDEAKLCRYMSRLMYILAACWLIVSAGNISGLKWLFWIGFAAFFLAAIIGAVYINTGNRIGRD